MSGRRKAAIIGAGVIGSGWAARFLLNGWDVSVFDPDVQAPQKLETVVANARQALQELYEAPLPKEGRCEFCETLEDCVKGAAWIQESVPERLEVKREVYRGILACSEKSAAIGSSTSGFRPSQLCDGLSDDARIVIAHPYNPVYLLPIVELVARPGVGAELIDYATEIFNHIGMKPLHVRHEIDAHIGDRLLEALWREALWLVRDDIATTREIDTCITHGFGLRWAQMGLFETYRIAGGEAGMAKFIAQFGPALHWPWSRLTDVPELDETLIEKIAAQSDQHSGNHSILELEKIRDRNLVGILKVLRANNWGAGETLGQHEAALFRRVQSEVDQEDEKGPLKTIERRLSPNRVWQGSNIPEPLVMQAFCEATNFLLELIGAGKEYVAEGRGYITGECHLRISPQMALEEDIYITSRFLSGNGCRIDIHHQMHRKSDDRVTAHARQMLVHTATATSTQCVAEKSVLDRLEPLVRAHAKLPDVIPL